MFTRSFLASCIAAALFVQVSASAQNRIVYTEASDLTLVGKLMDTPNPYHRVDTVAFKGFTKGENSQVRQSSGISVAFRTDSPDLYILTQFGEVSRDPTNTGPISARGYDLYIRENGQWRYAASKCRSVATLDQPLALITSMEPVVQRRVLHKAGHRGGLQDRSPAEPVPPPHWHIRLQLYPRFLHQQARDELSRPVYQENRTADAQPWLQRQFQASGLFRRRARRG